MVNQVRAFSFLAGAFLALVAIRAAVLTDCRRVLGFVTGAGAHIEVEQFASASAVPAAATEMAE